METGIWLSQQLNTFMDQVTTVRTAPHYCTRRSAQAGKFGDTRLSVGVYRGE
jgi:hypothetical protein